MLYIRQCGIYQVEYMAMEDSTHVWTRMQLKAKMDNKKIKILNGKKIERF